MGKLRHEERMVHGHEGFGGRSESRNWICKGQLWGLGTLGWCEERKRKALPRWRSVSKGSGAERGPDSASYHPCKELLWG